MCWLLPVDVGVDRQNSGQVQVGSGSKSKGSECHRESIACAGSEDGAGANDARCLWQLEGRDERGCDGYGGSNGCKSGADQEEGVRQLGMRGISG